MLDSDIDAAPGQSFTVEIEELPEGQFKAWSKNAPELDPVISRSRQGAMLAFNDKLHAFAMGRYKVPKGKAY